MHTHPPQHTTYHQTLNSHSQQRTLERYNKQLEEQLKDKQDSLLLQLKILRTHSNNNLNESYLACVEQLIQEQHRMRSYFTQKLIEKQLQIEQAKEMSEIINNYEKRIADLRGVLINKEGEISAVSYQFLKGTITRRQNLDAINSETLEKMALARYAKERKKLQIEISALQFTISQLQKGKQNKKRRTEFKQKDQTPNKQQTNKKHIEYGQHRGETEYFTAFSNNRQQDLMTDKVIRLIEEEIEKYNQQAELAQQLKQQLQSIEEQSNLNLQKYNKVQQEYSKTHSKSQQPLQSTQNKLQNQLSFIKQLEQEISNANSQLIGSQLFSSRDTNKQQNVSELSKSMKSTTTTLRQRRIRNLKQN